MRKILFLLLVCCMGGTMLAQPKMRRNQQATTTTTQQGDLTTRARISFPTAAAMSEDVVWRRDVYREISLTDNANAGLYYPVQPVGTQMNLFTYIFKLVMRGAIKAYSYDVNTGNENFSASAVVKPLKFLDDYHIFYERTDRGIHLDDSDIPSGEVKAYYVKESAYYDQATSTFHTKVLALCPVMYREDDFGDGTTKYPLFWVRYDDLAPYLAKQTIMTSNLNNAATMSMEDFFTMHCYKGKIYKTTNMLGQTLAQACGGDSVKMAAAQKQIDQEILAFENSMWGSKEKKDSLDSIQANNPKLIKARLRKQKQARKRLSRRSGDSGKSAAAPTARVTVRRERH